MYDVPPSLVPETLLDGDLGVKDPAGGVRVPNVSKQRLGWDRDYSHIGFKTQERAKRVWLVEPQATGTLSSSTCLVLGTARGTSFSFIVKLRRGRSRLNGKGGRSWKFLKSGHVDLLPSHLRHD